MDVIRLEYYRLRNDYMRQKLRHIMLQNQLLELEFEKNKSEMIDKHTKKVIDKNYY